ncbi:trehalose/maltose transport system permease protein MalF [Arthrobacter sp. Hiyo8]|nr:trehalose/maltose transport system permease protein MalF [Arthrobacter sp. Hiyo8]
MSTTTTQSGLARARRGLAPGGSGGGSVNRKSKLSGQTKRTFFWLLLPSIVLLILINGYPLIYAGVQATHDGSLIDTGNFVGVDNFATVLSSPAFWKAAQFTLWFTIVGVFGSWLVGLGLALLLRTKIPAGGTFKVLLLLPWVVPIVVSSTAWNWLVATRTASSPPSSATSDSAHRCSSPTRTSPPSWSWSSRSGSASPS